MQRIQKKVFLPNPDFSFENFRFVHQLVKTGGFPLVPEIVIIGKQGCGKTALLEALIGRPISNVGFENNGVTKRPLHFHLVSTQENENPNFLFQSQEEKKSLSIDVTSIPLQIEKLNKENSVFLEDFISVTQEYKYCFNVTFIDTPGLPYDTESEEFSQIDSYLQEILRPSHRLILYVEEPEQSKWDDVNIFRQILKKMDPYQKRTVWVSTKFHTLLDSFTTSNQLFEYFASTVEGPQKKIFWVTLPSLKERENAPSLMSFMSLQDQIDERDRRSLFLLNCSTKYYEQVGLRKLRHHLLKWCWTTYYECEIPKLLKSFEQRKSKNEEQTNKVKQLKSELNLRLLSSRYASRYIQTAQNILVGTSRGNPSVNGETRKEEMDDQYFVSSEWNVQADIPFETTRLYGGQQFERVFAEYRAIYQGLKVDLKNADKLDPEDKKYLWTACELVQKEIEELLFPIVEQLVQRINFIMTRIPLVVDNILETKSKKENRLIIDSSYYKNLGNYLKDLFNNYVEKMSQKCKNQCLEEFYSTKTIHWDINEMDFKKEDREELLNTIFDKLKKRILKNTLRKAYNIFLVPFMKADIWNEIQTQISVMPEQHLEEIFDLASINESLDEDIYLLEKNLEDMIHQEASFDFRTALVMAMGRTTQFTLDEVAKHADKDSCWLVIEGKVYAVEKFLNEHPGGEDVLLETAGRDATREFEDVGHSKSAREQLKEFYIGDVREPTAEELAAKRAVQASAAAERRDGDGVRANGLGKERLFAGGAFGAEPLSGGSSTWTLLKRLFVPVCIAVLVYLVREYSKQVQTGG